MLFLNAFYLIVTGCGWWLSCSGGVWCQVRLVFAASEHHLITPSLISVIGAAGVGGADSGDRRDPLHKYLGHAESFCLH